MLGDSIMGIRRNKILIKKIIIIVIIVLCNKWQSLVEIFYNFLLKKF